jgi:hypothetical protein
MKQFRDHIPPSFFANKYVDQFVTVLDKLLYEKNGEMIRLENFLNFYVSLDLNSQQNFLTECGKITQFSFLTKAQFVKMIEQSFTIWTYKSAPDSLTAFFTTVFGFTYSFGNNTQWWAPVVFQLNDAKYGMLPNGADLGKVDSAPREYPFMLAGNMRQYYNLVNIILGNTQDVLDTSSKRKELCAFIPNLLMMADVRTCSYTVVFKNAIGTTLETINF